MANEEKSSSFCFQMPRCFQLTLYGKRVLQPFCPIFNPNVRARIFSIYAQFKADILIFRTCEYQQHACIEAQFNTDGHTNRLFKNICTLLRLRSFLLNVANLMTK